MATTIGDLAAKAYTILAIILLSSWSLAALAITALNVMNENKGFLAPAASIGLLTFLVCRLIAVIKPLSISTVANGVGTIAHLIASANYGSRSGAFILFLMTCSWLFQLLQTLFVLVIATTIGASILMIVVLGEPVNEDAEVNGNATTKFEIDSNSTALVEFKEETGIDPTDLIRRFGPYTFFVLAVAVWLNFLSLCLYVLGHAAKSFSTVLSTPTQSVVVQQTTIAVSGNEAAPTSMPLNLEGPAPVLGDVLIKEKGMIDA